MTNSLPLLNVHVVSQYLLQRPYRGIFVRNTELCDTRWPLRNHPASKIMWDSIKPSTVDIQVMMPFTLTMTQNPVVFCMRIDTPPTRASEFHATQTSVLHPQTVSMGYSLLYLERRTLMVPFYYSGTGFLESSRIEKFTQMAKEDNTVIGTVNETVFWWDCSWTMMSLSSDSAPWYVMRYLSCFRFNSDNFLAFLPR